MLVKNKKNTSFDPIPFDFFESQRIFSHRERSLIREHSPAFTQGSVFWVFYCLVSLRTRDKTVPAGKKFLLEFTGLGSHNTLNKCLAILVELGLIVCHRFSTWNPVKRWTKVRWRYTFPYAENADYLELEEQEKSIPETASGLERSNIDLLESHGSEIINNPDIPAVTDQGFPQSTPEPTPIALPATQERREENPESAVFLTNESEQENPQTLSLTSQETPTVEETVKPLAEDLGKDEPQVIAEINDLVTTIKREKGPTERLKFLADDMVSLKKSFGALPVLTGLKCMMKTLPTILNPGGWLRVHLKNPTWLNRFRDKLEELHNIELAHQRNYLATMARLAEDTRQAEVNTRLAEEVDRLLAGLSVAERDSLWVEARAILTEKRGLITTGTVRAMARVLAREKFSKPLT